MTRLTKGAQTAPTDEVEGLGGENDGVLGDYPIDSVLIRHETRTVFEVLRRIEQGGYIMDPEFQRDFVWDLGKQSRLIESVLMRVPLPVFYLAENPDGKLVVVDGLQRLMTFKRYVSGEFALVLGTQRALSGRRFAQLAVTLKNRIEDCNLALYIIDSKVPERARLDIFERVNSGAPLTRQQMRNALYSGKATRWLRNEAATELFGNATGHSLKPETMRDREFVNRFCGFRLLGLAAYNDDMDDFLAKTLERMNALGDAELGRLSEAFRRTLTHNYELFGDHAFRKHKAQARKRSVLNASLFDVMSTGLARYETDVVRANKRSIRQGFFALMEDTGFIDAITYGPNGTTKVRTRFQKAHAMLREALGD